MYNFDNHVDRKSSDSIKWHKYSGQDIIPLWVADMDFQSPPSVIEALHQRVSHGVFGYAHPNPELYETLIYHLQSTYNWQIKSDWIVWLPGLVTGINAACRSSASNNEAIVTTTPIYPPFLTAPRYSGQQLVTTSMKLNRNQWQLDLDELRSCINNRTKLFLLSNPHNPTGRVFKKKELLDIAEICLKKNMLICSDEIHCDLILEPKCKHWPLASIDPEIADRTITLMAPSKTYNVAGLGCGFAVISNDRIRRRFKNAMNGIVPDVNAMGFAAAHAAYKHGADWLAALLKYLRKNRDLVFEAINNLPGLSMAQVQGTYLAWIDALALPHENPHRMFEKAGVGLGNGSDFGAPGFLRLNFGCKRSLLESALKRMEDAAGKDTKPETLLET
ncbi:MAG: putative C-S lyase [Desulfobacteraceae bacterium]|nr:putative C-S lyase [Desulfobacteraceae bacterium]